MSYGLEVLTLNPNGRLTRHFQTDEVSSQVEAVTTLFLTAYENTIWDDQSQFLRLEINQALRNQLVMAASDIRLGLSDLGINPAFRNDLLAIAVEPEGTVVFLGLV